QLRKLRSIFAQRARRVVKQPSPLDPRHAPPVRKGLGGRAHGARNVLRGRLSDLIDRFKRSRVRDRSYPTLLRIFMAPANPELLHGLMFPEFRIFVER